MSTINISFLFIVNFVILSFILLFQGTFSKCRMVSLIRGFTRGAIEVARDATLYEAPGSTRFSYVISRRVLFLSRKF